MTNRQHATRLREIAAEYGLELHWCRGGGGYWYLWHPATTCDQSLGYSLDDFRPAQFRDWCTDLVNEANDPYR